MTLICSHFYTDVLLFKDNLSALFSKTQGDRFGSFTAVQTHIEQNCHIYAFETGIIVSLPRILRVEYLIPVSM